MATESELALFSLTAYLESDLNSITPPDGWARDTNLSRADEGTGFAVDVYRHTTGEIVIAFRGTDNTDVLQSLTHGTDWFTNITAGAGTESPQIEQALEVVARALQVSSNITFTGHSLGGGLASVMSVFFNRPATVFAAAPFEHSARDRSLSISLNPLFEGITMDARAREFFVSQYFEYFQQFRQQHSLLLGSSDFESYRDAYAAGVETGDRLFFSRQVEVSHRYLEGEALTWLRSFHDLVLNIAGAEERIDLGTQSLLDVVSRHGMTSHAAFLLSEQLQKAAKSHSTLWEQLISEDLYAVPDRTQPIADFLTRLSVRISRMTRTFQFSIVSLRT